MIVKFLASKKSRGTGAVSYVLSKAKHKGSEPRILKGDEKLTRDIIKNNPFSQKATFGVLSFQEENIDENLKYKLMEEFEKTLLPGMDSNNFNILWVEHRDKGRLELNFIIPKIELISKKSLNPYWDKSDRTRINQWREIQNLKYGFSSPEDLQKAHSVSKSKDPKLNEMAQKLNESILKNISNFNSQNDVVDYINSIDGCKAVVPQTKRGNYINVYFTNNKRAIKLKGPLYDSTFTNGNIREIITSTRTKTEDQKTARGESKKEDTIEKLRKKLEVSIIKKVSEINKLFPHVSHNTDYDNSFNEATDDVSISEFLSQARAEQRATDEDKERERQSQIARVVDTTTKKRAQNIATTEQNERTSNTYAGAKIEPIQESFSVRAYTQIDEANVARTQSYGRISREIGAIIQQIHIKQKGIENDLISRVKKPITDTRSRIIETVQRECQEDQKRLADGAHTHLTPISKRTDEQRSNYRESEQDYRTAEQDYQRAEQNARGAQSTLYERVQQFRSGIADRIQKTVSNIGTKIQNLRDGIEGLVEMSRGFGPSR
jgi:hypothetical protein